MLKLISGVILGGCIAAALVGGGVFMFLQQDSGSEQFPVKEQSKEQSGMLSNGQSNDVPEQTESASDSESDDGAANPVGNDFLDIPLVVRYGLDESKLTRGTRLENPPAEVRAVYLTGWSAGNPGKVQYVLDLAKRTNINAVVIDIKDFSGTISYDTSVLAGELYGAESKRIRNINSVIELFHQNGLYVIGRITVFQDPIFAKARPELAVHSLQKLNPEAFANAAPALQVEVQYDENKEGTTGAVVMQAPVETIEQDVVDAFEAEQLTSETLWLDRKGLAWLDPAASEVWEYTVALAKDAVARGFDEINFDYIRFPSDGSLADMSFPVWQGSATKKATIEQFFSYLNTALPDIPLSADVFGLVSVNYDDLGIGQVLESTFGNFDYVSPMVYPSHYAAGFLGYETPAEYPYEVVHYSLERAQQRLNVHNLKSQSGRSTSIRPWLQNFSIWGVEYDAAKVKAQIQATQDALQSEYVGYMVWSPTNFY